MNRLLNIGFIPIGHWSLENINLQFELNSHHRSTNVLYSFISNGEIKYIGKTTMMLMRRLYGYQNPGPSQATNIRVNELLKTLLQQEDSVDIFILVDNGLLSYGGYKISLAAGLEDTLIRELHPAWNFRGNKKQREDSNSKKKTLTQLPDNFQPEVMEVVQIMLGKTYFNKGFFNIKTEDAHLFAEDNATIEIQLGRENGEVLSGYINRRANPNHTPRIMGGSDLKNWIRENFNLNDRLDIEVISPVSIRLIKN